ncbi:MAG: T9SS type A sorting domain-containing protein, partial [Crocinitomicaceae bacterium]|nr:T9SS type A sorting domain-containing protein [Crocinitomicaceae bacterium]
WYQVPEDAATSVSAQLQGTVANNMVVLSDGEVVVFYKDNNLNAWKSSLDNGSTWSSPGTLFPFAVTSQSTITADSDQNDKIHIAFKTGHFQITYANFNGASWSSPSQINTIATTPNDTIGFTQISVDRDGIIHLMWQQGNHKNSAILSTCWYAKSDDGGTTFSTPVSLSQSNSYDAAFPVADFSGNSSDTLLIAWRENITPFDQQIGMNNWNWDIKAAISTDHGNSWGLPFTIVGSGDDDWDPNVVIDKNNIIHVFFHVYHDNTPFDSDARVYHVYSTDAGVSWSTETQLSESNIRSHLVKTAYDYTNNLTWCFWKDERDFTLGNPKADLMGISLSYDGNLDINELEFITNHDTVEISYHNFKAGADGIVRATYNNSVSEGFGDTLYYTQRSPILAGNSSFANDETPLLFPNPASNYISITDKVANNSKYEIYSISGVKIKEGVIGAVSEIDISSLHQGAYILKIHQTSQHSNYRFIKSDL